MEDLQPNDFYAVRPELVLTAARCFGVRASILDGGARSLYNKAVALNSGKAEGRWGRHQCAVIKQFCQYTVATGSDACLPWQELVEDEMNYDGKEGIAARTGNRPLATVQRVRVKQDALQHIMEERSVDLHWLADQSGLPLRFLQAIHQGEWLDVATSTAELISAALDAAPEHLFDYPPTEARPQATSSPSPQLVTAAGDARETRPLLNFRFKMIFIFLVAVLLCGGFWGWLISSRYQQDDLASSVWHMSVELIHKNIPLSEEDLTMWRNGGYLELRSNGAIGFNWVDPNALVELPYPESNWSFNDNTLTIKLSDVIYPFYLDEVSEQLVTLNSTKSFEMTLQRISN
ncbi:MAG: hypothetical protein CMK89_00890 [Pseudomonadales bacterium]|nr:hypothetical protein [Pseudomonadales bacterium]